MSYKSKWNYLASLALLTEHQRLGVTTYVHCGDVTEYRDQCRKLILDGEINWQPESDGVLRTEIAAGPEGYQIVILCRAKPTIEEPQKPTILAVA